MSDERDIEYRSTVRGQGSGDTAVVAEPENPIAAAGVFDDVEPTPGVAKPDAVLTATNVVRAFGGLKAVDVEYLEVQRGAITALIGPNGAGKTTFFNLLTGFDTISSGAEVTLDDKRIDGVPPHRLARRGMVRTFQLTKALSRLSVLDNMKLGATDQIGESFLNALIPGRWAKQEAEIEAEADALLRRFDMSHMRDEYAGTMSGGQRKLLEMARALMTDPTLVMLDEPMAGVNPALTQSLLGHVKELRADGRTVIFVEHDMDVVQDISDWVVVMAEGVIIAEGTPDDISSNRTVIDAYLGAHHDIDLGDELPDDPTRSAPADEGAAAPADEDAAGAADD